MKLRLNTFISNIALYYLIRCANAVIILGLIPYTARILDQENFGAFMYTITISILISMIVSYGAQLSGIRSAAQAKDNSNKVAAIISETLTAQCYLSLLLLATTIVLNILPTFQHQRPIYDFALIYGISQGFNPLWISQSIDKLKALALIECVYVVAAGTLFLMLLPRYPRYSTGLIILISGRLAVNILFAKYLKKLGVRLYLASWRSTLLCLKNGFQLFFLIASVSVYGTLSTVILGHFSGLTAVGAYAGIERLTRGVTAFILPISQATTPSLYFLSHDPKGRRALNTRVLVVAGSVSIFIAIVLYVFSSTWSTLFLGTNYHESSLILKILCWLIPCYVLSTILSSQYLIPEEQEKVCNLIYFFGGLTTIPLAMVLAPHYGAIGMAGVVVVVEASVLMFMVLAVRRDHRPIKEHPEF